MTKNRLFFAEVTITNKRRLSLATSSCSFQCPGIWHSLLSTDLPVAALLGADPHSLQRNETQKQSHEKAAREGTERLAALPPFLSSYHEPAPAGSGAGQGAPSVTQDRFLGARRHPGGCLTWPSGQRKVPAVGTAVANVMGKRRQEGSWVLTSPPRSLSAKIIACQ